MKTLQWWFYLMLGLVLLSGCVSKSKYVELESDLSETQQRLAQKNQELQTLEERRQQLEFESNELAQRNDYLKRRIEQMEADVAQMEADLVAKEERITTLDATRQNIEMNLREQIAAQQIKLEDIEGKLKITFVDKILFDSGSARIKQKGRESLRSLAESLKDAGGRNIVVEGHTDDVGVGPSLKDRYPTNWELSTARATSVVRFLQEEADIDPTRLSAVGYSFYKPVAPNDDEEGRRQNRRIEIILAAPIR